MYRVAISGHRGLSTPTARLVDHAIRAALTEHAPDVTGLSCLADGADQIFARAVTDLGGTLEAASKLMVDQADELYAVWDGKPPRSYGGTADVVAYVREHGAPVSVIWPDGARRDD